MDYYEVEVEEVEHKPGKPDKIKKVKKRITKKELEVEVPVISAGKQSTIKSTLGITKLITPSEYNYQKVKITTKKLKP